MRNVFGFLFIYDILKRNISKINYIKVIHVSYKKFESTKKKNNKTKTLQFSDLTITTVEFLFDCF